jgi:FixJ family two-component response regulator
VPVISIVDDDSSVRRALGRLLRTAGYRVEVFASAGEFLDSGPVGRISCLILDVRLEGMTGLDLQERLAAERADFPIIFITAHDDAPTRLLVQQAGAAAYLPKPFDGAALLAAVSGAAGPA